MNPLLISLLSALGSGALVTVITTIANRRKIKSEAGKNDADAFSTVVDATGSIIQQLQQVAAANLAQYQEVFKQYQEVLARLQQADEERIQMHHQLTAAQEEIASLHKEIKLLREYITNIGGDGTLSFT